MAGRPQTQITRRQGGNQDFRTSGVATTSEVDISKT